jgi:hypothetical protein
MIANRSLLLLARSLLRFLPPQRALFWLRYAGGALPPLRSAAEVRIAMESISGRGTCLSRSLAIAARARNVDVVIGVDPRRAKGGFAHAWLEMAGEPVDPAEPTGEEIVRFSFHVDGHVRSGRLAAGA